MSAPVPEPVLESAIEAQMLTGFPLSRQQRDTAQGLELIYWLQTPSGAERVVIHGERAVFFVLQEQREAVEQALKELSAWEWRDLDLCDFQQRPVAAVYTPTLSLLHQSIECLQAVHLTLMEEDIRPVDRYLMERFIFSGATVYQQQGRYSLRAADYQPRFRLLSLDIETTMKADRILSIALESEGVEQVLMLGRGEDTDLIRYLPNERLLLQCFVHRVREIDPDILIGWSVIGFDLRVLQARAKVCGVSLLIGRDQQPIRVEQSGLGKWYARIGGRVVLDGIDTLKGATWQFERYSLEFVSRTLLGKGKAIDHVDDRGAEIQRLYAEDKPALAHYNIEDCRLVTEIFDKTGLIPYLIERSRLTGLSLDKVGGSAQAFDNLYLPTLHRRGYVAPEYASGQTGLKVPGGFVMESRPGLYQHVLVLDFKSLYPSIIRTFQIDPMGLAEGLKPDVAETDLVPGFHGAIFSKRYNILPGIIEHLWQARDKAKQQGNSALSQAIKILMNACYGVLGSNQCRFYDQRLSASITLRGHQILTQTAEYIETQLGHRVIYGDTDSVFVWLGDNWSDQDTAAYGEQLVTRLNDWWRQQIQQRFGLDTALELQFETHYEHFLMPRMRHSEQGSKKRYAGVKRLGEGKTELVFKGLEQVRSDWTRLARDFQHQLYGRIFAGEPWQPLVRSTVAELLDGKRDHELIYHRRLRRPLQDYQRNVPPHVRAARMLNERCRAEGLPEALRQGDSVSYLITVNGPEPQELRQSPIDYQHYLDRQLMPVADTILPFLGETFTETVAPQRDLFDQG
ncbi:DNA polymerase II [Nitrincola sp. MINF-07-Sa-05]|uniref:DNA polymerase II n=1 Tax=Nitrincola salilacus TaxID=3400273 RepID=UPI003917E2B0